MAREKSKIKWEPTQKLKHPDGIISSDYPNAKPFIPSYEREPRPDMKLLLSMEYARQWQKELEALKEPVTNGKKPSPKNYCVLGANKKRQNLKVDNKENRNTSKQKQDMKKK